MLLCCLVSLSFRSSHVMTPFLMLSHDSYVLVKLCYVNPRPVSKTSRWGHMELRVCIN